jgi:hypothetical protein
LEEDALVELVSESELDPVVDSESEVESSEQVPSEEVFELESEDEEDDDCVDLLLPRRPVA